MAEVTHSVFYAPQYAALALGYLQVWFKESDSKNNYLKKGL